MAKRKRGFFARLFGLGRRKHSFELSVGSVLARLMQRALSTTAGTERTVTAERIDAEALASGLGRAGWRSAFFRDSDPPDLILFFPGESLGALCGNAAEGPEEFPPLLKEATENLADFLLPAAEADGAGKSAQRLSRHRFFLRYAAEHAEVMWRASGSECYRLDVSAGDSAAARIYACVDPSVHGRTQNALESDDSLAKAVRAVTDPRKKDAADPPALGDGLSRSVVLRGPREFVAGNLFLMPRIPCGKYLLETRFSAAAVLSDRSAYLEASGVWAFTSCSVAGKKWPVWYFFPAKEPGAPAPSVETLKGIAGCALRESLPGISSTLGARAENPGIAMGSMPDLSGTAGYVVLKAALAVGPRRFTCDVFVDYTLVSLLAKRLLTPEEISCTSRGAKSVLPLLLAANAALFAKQISSFHRAFIPGEAEGNERYFPFGAFLDLIPAHDRAIVLQNYVLRSLGTRSIKSLFSYAESAQARDGSTITRVSTPYAFDEAALLSLLPESARSDWLAGGRVSLGTASDHYGLTTQMLEGIGRSAQKGTLLVTRRTTLVLERFFLPRQREKNEESLRKIAADGVPYSAVRRLPKAQIQQFFATQANRAIALSILGSEDEFSFVRQNVSKKRAAGLMEDIAFIRRQHGEGRIEVGEILEAKLGMDRAARKMAEELARQAARDQARRAGGSAARRAGQ